MESRGFYSFREQGGTNFQSFALEVVPGHRCQLRCRNCYKRNGVVPSFRGGNMPAEFVHSAMRQAKECGFSEVVFIGGEPTLHPRLPEFVQFGLRLGLSPIVCTNGLRLADQAYTESLALPEVTLVMHAFLPPESAEVQDMHAVLPGYNAMLQVAYTNVLGRSQVRLISEIVVIREFFPFIPAVFEWCREKGIAPFIEINRRTDHSVPYPGTVSSEGVRELFERLVVIDPHAPEQLVPPAYGQPCTMSITGLHVKNFGGGDYGGVYSCCAQGLRHGDLRQTLLAEILRDPTLLVYKDQDRWIYGPCRECPHYPVCRGGCRGEAYLAFGCARASSPACWHLPTTIRNDPAVMCPPICAGCPLEGNTACHPRRESPSA